MKQVMNNRLRDITEFVSRQIGEGDDEPLDVPLEKLEVEDGSLDDIEPGMSVEIQHSDFEQTDEGYVFVLPGLQVDRHDVVYGGVVHIPKPFTIGKGRVGPMWYPLVELVHTGNIEKIIFS